MRLPLGSGGADSAPSSNTNESNRQECRAASGQDGCIELAARCQLDRFLFVAELDELDLLSKINTGSPQNGSDLAIVEPGSVVFNPYRVFLFVELDLANPINFPGIVERQH